MGISVTHYDSLTPPPPMITSDFSRKPPSSHTPASSDTDTDSGLSAPLLISPLSCKHEVQHRGADNTISLQGQFKWCIGLMTSLDLSQALRPRNTYTIHFTITIQWEISAFQQEKFRLTELNTTDITGHKERRTVRMWTKSYLIFKLTKFPITCCC